MSLDPRVLAFAQADNFAVFTTPRTDGHPVTQPMWVDADDDFVLINTEKHRRKFRNVEQDPRVTVTIVDRNNPYVYVEVRGRVEQVVDGPEAPADYRRWLATLETILAERAVADRASVSARADAFLRAAEATPHGQPIRLENDPLYRG